MNNKKIEVEYTSSWITFKFMNVRFSYWNEDLYNLLKSKNFDNEFIVNFLEKRINDLNESLKIWVNKKLVELLKENLMNEFNEFNDWLDLLEDWFNEEENLLFEAIQKAEELIVISKDDFFITDKEKNLLRDKWLLKDINSDFSFFVNISFWEKVSFQMNYWKIVQKILLSNYLDNYVISWKSSLKIHSWDLSRPEELEVRVFWKNVNYDLELLYWHKIKIRTSKYDSEMKFKSIQSINWVNLNLQNYHLSLTEYFSNDDIIENNDILWISLKEINQQELEEIFSIEKNKTSISRLSEFYFVNHSRANYIKVQNVLWRRLKDWEDIYWTMIDWFNYWKKNINELNYSWNKIISRYQEKLFWFLNQIKRTENDFNKFTKKEILDKLEKDKVSDIYHSTTIEWYKIKEEEITAIIKWEFPEWFTKEKKEKYLKEIKEYLTIVNYSSSLDYVKELIDNWIEDITQDIIKNIRWKLFDKDFKKQVDYSNVQRYINTKNWLSKHIPPSPEQILDCMSFLENEINKIEDWWKKAIILHALFVDIHPFSDWNWRTWRFLMNLVLSSCWIWWLIIKEEDREKFFSCMEKASYEWDIKDLEEFIYWVYEKQFLK